ncbi:MAG: HAMP domain-containing sensor histidine kinase [Gemmatimonadota bacterium]
MFRSFGPRSASESSTRPLGVILLATVALCAWLAFQAYGSARSHRDTTEAVLRDYAEIAAAEYARTARSELSLFFDIAFDEVPRRVRSERLPPLDDIERELDDAMRAIGCRCPAFREPIALFRVELPARTVVAEPSTVAAETVRAVVDRIVTRHAETPTERYGLFELPAGLPSGASDVAYATVQLETGELRATYVILLAPEALAQLGAHWQETTPLLPDAIAGDLETDSMLFVSLTYPSGRAAFESAVRYPETFSSRDTLDADLGSYVVTAAIRPEAADRLVIGGLPRSRLPVTLALLALAIAVGAAGLWEIRRHEHLGRLREDFISSVSHELRTPLTQIRMLAELQADGKLRSEEERERAVRVIRREAQRLTQLVENVLQFSRLRAAPHAGRAGREVDVEEEVRDVVASFRLLADAADASIEVDVTPGLRARAHREAVRRILINLLDNALKYGPPGQTVRVAAREEGGHVCLSVKDEGAGVPAEEREAIWEPYRRLARDIDSPRPGSGVGLAVVRSLATEHGGKAWLDSASGSGARFVVELPRWESPGGTPAAVTVAT